MYENLRREKYRPIKINHMEIHLFRSVRNQFFHQQWNNNRINIQ